jgi:hypothetical protein
MWVTVILNMQVKHSDYWKDFNQSRFFTPPVQAIPAHAGSSLADFPTLNMEAIRFSETPVSQDLHGTTSQKTAFSILILA